MRMISRITLGQGLSLGGVWQELRQLLKGRYVEVWTDVFEEGVFWVTDEAKAALEEARKRITTGLIGLIVVVAGIFLVDLIGGFLGLDILQPGLQIISLP